MPTPSAARPDVRRHEEPWWTSAVVYQVYVRSFADSDGDGIGDLRGLLSKVDYLSRLGIDVVWLSPIYPSPHDDGGYDVSDYQDIDPLFGTLADFDELVAALHARGIKLIVDLVVNHSSDEHPWFKDSRSDRSSPYRDWYWWRPARPGTVPGKPGSEPNNWRAAFSGSAWEFDEDTQEYYLHLFSRRQPDLNWENPQVRRAVHQMMRWWLDRGVDGFRMDVINMISKDLLLPDGPPIPGEDFGDGGPFYLCGPRLDEFLQEMRQEAIIAASSLSGLLSGWLYGLRRHPAPARRRRVGCLRRPGAGPCGRARPPRSLARPLTCCSAVGRGSGCACSRRKPRCVIPLRNPATSRAPLPRPPGRATRCPDAGRSRTASTGVASSGPAPAVAGRDPAAFIADLQRRGRPASVRRSERDDLFWHVSACDSSHRILHGRLKPGPRSRSGVVGDGHQAGKYNVLPLQAFPHGRGTSR
ncbi:alpha-amylase family glycosyl hydrolase [Nonomuraea sp. NPDC049480]|uniref:alpha-amylase family glycosyl hydrolase n=1 Tax=Nonomuraea sp. NPDC049480 TaxID=3364353 RepID=UPI00379A9F41